jgi:hypothetical protein
MYTPTNNNNSDLIYLIAPVYGHTHFLLFSKKFHDLGSFSFILVCAPAKILHAFLLNEDEISPPFDCCVSREERKLFYVEGEN